MSVAVHKHYTVLKLHRQLSSDMLAEYLLDVVVTLDGLATFG